MKNLTFTIALILLLFNTSCNKDESYIFEKAQKFIYVDEDSLQHYIKLIKSPEKLPPHQRARFGLIQSALSSYNKEHEHLVDYSIEYYTSERDTVMMIRSYINKSNYYQNPISEKISFLNLAKDLAIQADLKKLIARLYLNIGYCYERTNDDDTAFYNFSKAEEYAPKDDYIYGAVHWDLARAYNKKGMKDKAIENLLNVVENAKIHSLPDLSPAYKQLSERYQDLEDYKKALEYINLSIKHRTNIKEAPSYNLAKAIIFINTQELDSARLYLSYAIESPNPYISNRALGFLYKLNTDINQYDKAYYTKLNEDGNLLYLKSNEDSYVLQQKYKEEKLKNENNQLKIEKQQQKYYSLVITIILLLVFVSTYMLYSYKKKQQTLIKHKHEEQLLKEKALLHESQNLLLKRENELALLQQKAATLRASLFKKMSISQKLPSLDKEGVKDTVNKKISLTEQDFVELRKTVDAAYNDFSKKLTASFPSLSEDDIIFCCLIKIEVDMQDLSDIYCISKAGITKRKMRIKKDKLKIQTNESLDAYIQQF